MSSVVGVQGGPQDGEEPVSSSPPIYPLTGQSDSHVRICSLVLAAVLVTSNFRRRRYPMIGMLRGVKTTARCAALGSRMYYFCRCVLYWHGLLLSGGSLS